MSARSDEALLGEYARIRSQSAFRELAMRHGSLVYSACLRYLGRSDLAEDAAQAVFLLLSEKAHKIKVRTTLVPWLLSTSKLVCRDVARAERRRMKREVPLDESILSINTGEDVALIEALDKLKGAEREAVVLRFYQGLSLAEVGKAQGVSEDAARMRIQRGLSRLRTQFAQSLTIPQALLERLSNPVEASDLMKSLAHFPRPSMTIPLTASLGCGGAAILIISAIHSQKPVPPGVAPSAIGIPAWPANRPLALIRDAKPSTSLRGKLDRPFTLVYDVTFMDQRTKAMKDYAMSEARKSLQQRLDQDEITKQEMDSALADDARHDAIGQTKGRLTIASNGRDLLVEGETERDNPTVDVVLIRNSRTYTFSPHQNIRPFRFEGVLAYNLSNLPFIGPELPNLPIMKGRNVVNLMAAPNAATDGQANRLVYLPGQITPNKNGSVKQVVLGSHGKTNTYDLSGHISFLGEQVAGRIVWTKYMGWRGYPDQGKPQSRTEYKLVGCSPKLPSLSIFTPETYLSDGERVQVNFTGNHSVSFLYKKAGGSLDDQAASAKSASNQ